MTEPQILQLTNEINEGVKLKASREQLAECARYWALRCAYEGEARLAAERELKIQAAIPKVHTGLVLPNGYPIGSN